MLFAILCFLFDILPSLVEARKTHSSKLWDLETRIQTLELDKLQKEKK